MADDGVAKVLAQCAPRPTDVADERFTDTFRKPLECLRMLRADRALDKTAPEIDDAIKALARHGLPVLRARVPDLGRIAELVWGLHRGTEQPL